MSIVDQPRPAARDLGHRPGAPGIGRDIGAWLVNLPSRAWHELRTNRPLRVSFLSAVAAWVILQLAFVAWVHYTFEGNSHHAFLPSTTLGIPSREAAAGFTGVCKYGYDGQIYYWQSNDLFGRTDTYKHIDEPLYRYQRIGIPMLAGGLASLLGYELTPPLLYHTLQFGIAAAGFGLLMYWLMVREVPAAYALTWLLSVGTLQSLWMGILDAPADTFFVAAMMALFARRMSFYVVAASLLLLTREMYCLFAFGVFVATAMNRFDWRDVAVYWKRVALSAVPGIVMLSWTAYLAIHFHMSPIKARTNNPNMSSWPFKMAVKYIKTFYNTANLFEFRMALISTFTLILVLVLLVRGFRRLPLAIVCTLPYVLITTALGAAMWESHGSHMRVATAWVLIGVFMLPFDKSLLLRFMLVLQGIVGVSVHTDLRLLHPALHSSNLLHEEAGFYQPNPAGSPDNELLNDVRSSVEWVDAADVVRPQYHGVWDRVHREIKPITVAITNRTDVAWQPGFGRHPLWLGYILYDGSGQKQLATHSIMLNKAIGPGETKEVTAYLELRRPGKNYVVEFSVWQDGVGWFVRTDPSFGTRYQFRVE